MAGTSELKSYYDKDVKVEYSKSHNILNMAQPGKHLSQEIIESAEIKLIRTDDLFYKIEYTSYNRQKIEVSHCKELEDKQIDFPDEEFIIGFAEVFADEDTVNVFLNSKYEPIFVSERSGGTLYDMKQYEKADPLTLDFLIKKSTDKDFNILDWAIVAADSKVYYIRDNDAIAKLFIPFMMEWFENKFPGLMVADEHNNCAEISKLGFRILLQMFILNTYGYADTSGVTFQIGSQFSISIPELLESPLSGGTMLKEAQLKSIAHMLPIKAKTSLKDVPYFSGEIENDPDDIELSFNEHVNCTWHTFVQVMEMFPIGCDIHLAPGQVILDSDDNEIFSEFDIANLVYHGPEFLLEDRRNTIDVTVTGESINTDLRTRMIKFFDSDWDLSIHSWKIEGKRAK